MAGLLDSSTKDMGGEQVEQPEQGAAVPAGQGGVGEPDNPILKQIEDGIEASVPAELKKQYMTVVVAGMKVMYSKNTSKFLEQRLNESGDIVKAVSNGIADLLILIFNESGRKMSIPAAMLAAFTLMANALDFAEKAGKVEITPELVTQCTEATWQAATSRFGITKDKIDQVVAQSGKGAQGGAAPADGAQQPVMEG